MDKAVLNGGFIDKINPELVGKFNLENGDEWIAEMYKQFGVTDIDALTEESKKDPEWFNRFRWTENCENDFLEEVIRKNKAQAKVHNPRLDFAWISLSHGPRTIYPEWKPQEEQI